MASPRHVPCSEFSSTRQTEVAYPHDRQMQELVTRGIKANGKKKFKIELEGEVYYDLLKRLDKEALETDSIMDLRECMHLADRIMEQLRAQGFYG
jgi:hypothetical protein